MQELQSLQKTFLASMPNWLNSKIFVLSNIQWVGLLFLIIASVVADRTARFYIGSLTLRFFNKKGFQLKNKHKKAITTPLGICAFSLVWILGINILGLPGEIFQILHRIGLMAFTVACVWGSYYLVDVISLYFYRLAALSDNKFDDILVPLLRKACKLFVLCVGAIFVAKSFTLNVTNLVAGLGLGGLAFALAAKDTLSNLFGSLTVILDRPFQIGDWVVIGDKIEGVVQEVGFRSTQVKTFYDSIISVPNNNLSNVHIDNYGRRKYRRYSTHLDIQYDTDPKNIEVFCEGIRQIILKHQYTRKDYFHVYLNNLSSSSIRILLYVFWNVPDWNTELHERHHLLIDILRLAKDLNINFAFPTQTLHLFNEPHPNLDNSNHNQMDNIENITDKIIKSSVTFSTPRSSCDDMKNSTNKNR